MATCIIFFCLSDLLSISSDVNDTFFAAPRLQSGSFNSSFDEALILKVLNPIFCLSD